jgi:hypothetical protein
MKRKIGEKHKYFGKCGKTKNFLVILFFFLVKNGKGKEKIKREKGKKVKKNAENVNNKRET